MPVSRFEVPYLYNTFPSAEIYHDSHRYFEMYLDGTKCLLQMVNTHPDDPDKPEWIAYYDARIPELQKPGAAVLSQMLVDSEADVVITPSSKKSTDLVELARQLAIAEWAKRGIPREIDKIIFQKGTPEEMVAQLQQSVFSTEYQPITSPQKMLVMTVSQDDCDLLIPHLQTGNKAVMLDDVYSTGGTRDAVNTLYNLVRARAGFGVHTESKLPICTVIRECPRLPSGKLEITPVPSLRTAAIIPVFHEQLPPAAFQ